MNTLLKLTLAATAIGVTVWGVDKARKIASGFNFDIVGYGRPTIAGWNITVPLVIRFTNPSPLPIAADRVLVDIFIKKSGQWIAAARIDQPVTIPAGISDQTIQPTLNLQNIFGGNILSTLNTISQALQNRSLEVRTDVTVSYGNVSLPVQSFTESIPLA